MADEAADYLAMRRFALIDSPLAFSNTPDQEAQITAEDVQKRWAEGLDFTMAAFVDGQLAAISNFEREKAPRFAHKGMVWSFFVHPAHRRTGIGRDLMLTTMREAFSDPELRQINLGVNAINPAAQALYESCGFRAFAYERNYMRVDGAFYDEFWMVCFRESYERLDDAPR